MSKGGGKTVETRQDTSPWAAQQPYLQNLFSRAESLYGRPTVAAQSPYTQQGIQRLAGESGPGSLTSAALDQYRKTINGDYADISKNPYAQSLMNMAGANLNAKFQGDNYGNSAHQEWLARTLTDAALPIAQQERANQLNASANAPSMAAAGIAPLLQAGQMSDTYAQRLTDSPWEALQRYQGSIAGNYGGTTTGTQPYTQSNPFADLLGAGLGVAGLYKLSTGKPIFGG